MWPGPFAKNPPLRRPVVKAEFTTVPRSPFVKQDGTIHISVEFWQILERSAFLIAHDILVSSKPAVTDAPMLYHPYESGQLLAIMQPISRYLTRGGINEIQSLFPCTDPTCRRVFSLSLMGSQMFVLGHEFAHLFYGDRREGDTTNRNQEIRADKKAFEFLQTAIRGLPGDNPTRVQLALYGGPAMVLRYGRENPDNAGLDGFIEARIEDMIKYVPEDIRYDVKDMTGAYEPLTPEIGSLRLEPSLVPDLVSVDGVRIPPAGLGTNISITDGFHAFLARSGDSFAYEYRQCGYGEEVCVVKLHFRELLPTPLIRPPEPDGDSKTERQQWFEILLATSNRDLQPRDRNVAWLQWQALANLKLGSFIHLDSSVPVAETLSRRINESRRADEALSNWSSPTVQPVQIVSQQADVERCQPEAIAPKPPSDSAAEACVDEVDHSLLWHTDDPKAGSDFEYRYRNTCSRVVRCFITVTAGERARWAGMGPSDFHGDANKTYACTLKPDAEKWVTGSLPWDRKPDTMPSMQESLSCVFEPR